MKAIAWFVGAVTLAASGAYVFIYLYRWEWHRALFVMVVFVAVEVALCTALVLRQLTAAAWALDHLSHRTAGRSLDRRLATRLRGLGLPPDGLVADDAELLASETQYHDDPELRRRAQSGDALFGTVESWLIWKMTGGKVHATDVTNASRTMLFDIRALEWSQALLEDLSIPREMLPAVLPSSGA